MVSRYVTNGSVKQEGVCLFPPPGPPQHYRMITTPQRTDGFHVTTPPAFVAQQPPNQGNTQGPTLRGMAPTGPPTQASTPPNTELKVQQMSQQTSVNLAAAYMPQAAQVRGTSQNFYGRPAPPPSQTPRMTNHRQGQQAIYPTAQMQFVHIPPNMQHTLFANPNVQFQYSQRPTASFVQQFQPVAGQPIASYAAYPQTQTTPPMYYYPQLTVQRSGPPPPVQSAPQNHTQPTPPSMVLPQNTQQTGVQQKNKRRAKAIPIIDPNTGKDKLTEMFEQQDQDESHPPSGESSARQTPQPAVPNPSKEVQAAFAKQVAQAISNDEAAHSTLESDQPPSLEHMAHPMFQHSPPSIPPTQAVQNNRIERIDQIVQSSNLKVQAKEFVSQTAKETTPVVSALSDAVEVTITKQQPKDRESPAKGRKQREQTPREHKEQPAPPKDAFVCEKPPSSSIKEEPKQKQETIGSPPVQNLPQPSIPVVVTSNTENSSSCPRDEKKNSKKEKIEKVESKGTAPVPAANVPENNSENVPTTASSISIPASDSVTTVNAKSKHNASQKSKDVPKQSSQQSAGFPSANAKPSQTALPVPPSQPAKANNRSNKMRELNFKGSMKEGSDMDAFSDTITVNENMNSNSSSPSNQKDTINVNSTVIIENSKNVNSSVIVDSNKKTESNDIPTIKPEIKTLPKGRVDVTDIVKDVPKPLKSIITAPMESQDEPDRASLANDKLVQAKNKANKAVVEHNDVNNVIDIRNNSTSKDVPNADDKKVYTREFLMSLRNVPKSKIKPENIIIPTDILANNEDRGRVGDISRYPVGGRGTTDFAPSFSSGTYPGRSSQRGSMVTKRGSQQGNKGGGGGAKGGKQNVIKVSISVKEDVKLHETENAWKPARFNAGANMTEDDKKTEQLYRKVRGILNKLTPQKFETLLSQIQSLTIDTCERLQGVIDLVFEKAVDEPNFSVAYALLCRELALMQVPNSEELRKKDGLEYVNFRKLLVTRCQREFEKNSIDEEERNLKVKEIEECTDPEKKKELMIELEEYDRRLRMKSVGNIRFIGELYKQQMLTGTIMVRCVINLLEDKNEESLECLCKLLSTVGKELESKGTDLSPYFNTMKEIVDKKHGRISSRVRFMLQDVIDLRNAKWVPRRQDLNPKTIDQIQKEADSEHMTNQALNALPIPKRDDRGPNMSSDKKRRNVTDDSGWSTAPTRTRPPFAIVSDKLKNKLPQPDEPLGSSQMFGNWTKGSAVKSGVSAGPPTNSNNMYAALENIGDSDRRGLGGMRSNKDPYSSKPSLERYKQYDGRGSRSGSQQRSRDSSTTSQRSTGGTTAPLPTIPKVQPPPVSAPALPELTLEQLERRLKNILEEYLNDCCTIADCDQEIKTTIPKSSHMKLVSDGYNGVLERSKTARMRTGELFAHLIKLGTLSIEDYCKGLDEVLSVAEELTIDIPKIWDYLAEIIAPLIYEEMITFEILHKCCELLISQGHMPKLMGPLFELIAQKKGHTFLQSRWQASRLQLEEFMPEVDINKFVSDKHLEYLLESSSNVPAFKSSLTFDEIREKLLSFFNATASFDEVTNWIKMNVGEAVKENHFIRALMTAILEHSTVNMKLRDEVFKNHYNYFHWLFGNSSDTRVELQCLYAVQALVNKWEHPPGLLLAIFERLFEDGVIPHESFIAWENSNDPAEQASKGVALKQLTSFFISLKEAEDETESSASEEA